MITEKGLNMYGYISIAVMLLLLGLVWFRVVPESLYYPLFFVAMLLFAVRLVLRFMHARQKSRKKSSPQSPE